MINKTSAVLLAFIMVMTAGLCLADDGWQSSLVVSSGNASSRLSFGQNPSATNGLDGFYDVPALFSGQLQAAFSVGGEDLWRDIRAIDNESVKEWRLEVASETGEAIKISWGKNNLPGNSRLMLIDVENGKSLDMKSLSGYSLPSSNGGELIIEISNL